MVPGDLRRCEQDSVCTVKVRVRTTSAPFTLEWRVCHDHRPHYVRAAHAAGRVPEVVYDLPAA